MGTSTRRPPSFRTGADAFSAATAPNHVHGIEERPAVRPVRTTTFVAALTSLAAGGVHLATGGPHVQESAPLGVAFIVTGWLQLLLGAVVLARPRRVIAVPLTMIHVAAIGAWAVSRSVGLPFGHPGGAPFGVGGVTAVSLEVLAIAALAVFIHDPGRVRHLSRTVALAVVMVVLGGASVAVATIGTGHGGPSADEATDDHHDGGPDDTGGGSPSSDAHRDSDHGHAHADAAEGGASDRERGTQPSADPDDGGEGHDGEGHDHDH